MSSIKGAGLAAGAKKPPTQHLVEHIPFSKVDIDLTNNQILGTQGLAIYKPFDGTFNAGSDTDNPGSYTAKSLDDRLLDNGTLPTVWGHPDYSFIWSFRIKIPISAAGTNGEIIACYDGVNKLGQRLELTSAGVLKWYYNGPLGIAAKFGTIVIDDGDPHHILIYVDRTGDDKRAALVDGIEDISEVLSSAPWLDDDTTPQNAAVNTLGCWGTLASSANGLFTPYPDTSMMDLQMYRIAGNLPSNSAEIFEWLRTNVNYPVPADMWP